jgi:alkylated DNA nucleotide flippase Atl1
VLHAADARRFVRANTFTVTAPGGHAMSETIAEQRREAASSTLRYASAMADWNAVAKLVVNNVKRGSVTTCKDLAESIYGSREGRGPRTVRTIVDKWSREDRHAESHRVVHDDGSLPNVDPRGEKLRREGVPFGQDEKVIIADCRAKLPTYEPKDPVA